jgi:predicted glycosyltransferase involved in capsule biosynthesis
LKAVLDWYKTNLPDIEIIFANASEDIWLPSASRNIGVKRAQEARTDVVIMNDADTIPQISSLLETIEAASNDNLIHLPYMNARYLNEQSSEQYYNNEKLIEDCSHTFHPYPNADGGIWVFKPEVWWELGGMDEHFKQWGYEDRALHFAHHIIKGQPFVRHDGDIYSFNHKEQWHDDKFNQTTAENRDHFMRYYQADTPEKMLKLIRG